MEKVNKCLFVAAYLSIYDQKGIESLGYKTWSEALNDIAEKLGGYKYTYIKNLRDEFDAITGNHRIGWVSRSPRKIIEDVYAQVKDLIFDEYFDDVKIVLSGKRINDFNEKELGEEGMGFSEGHKLIQKTIKYERNPKARKACLDFYGPTCQICGFNSEKMYGSEFKCKIEVHHIKPLSLIKEDYIIDPIEDLIPVCPNCHMILHSKGNGEVYTIEEMKSFIKNKTS